MKNVKEQVREYVSIRVRKWTRRGVSRDVHLRVLDEIKNKYVFDRVYLRISLKVYWQIRYNEKS